MIRADSIRVLAALMSALGLIIATNETAWAISYDQEVLADNPAGYWRFEAGEPAGVALDSSGNGRHGTYVGGVTPGFFPGAALIGGNSGVFDGTTGFVQLPGNWGGGPELTIEAWVNTAAVVGDFQTIVGTPSGGVAHFQLAPFGNSVTYVDNCCVTLLPPPPEGPTDTWRHIALTSKSGDTRIFVNGVQIGADPLAFGIITPSGDVHIGNGHVNTRFFNGLLDEVAIYDTALSPQRVLDHYNAGGNPPPPPPPAAMLLAHWSFDQGAQDVSGNGHDGVLTGGAAITGAAKVGGGALDLRGNLAAPGKYVDVPSTVIDSQDSYSISFFVAADSLSHPCCHAIFANDGFPGQALHVNIGTGSGRPESAVAGNTPLTALTTSGVPTDGSWVHVAFAYNALTGETKAYYNGVLEATTVHNGGNGSLVGAAGPSAIGAWDGTVFGIGVDRFLDGRIDDLRIFKGVLTDVQVRELAAVPEPSAWILLATATAGLAYLRRRRQS